MIDLLCTLTSTSTWLFYSNDNSRVTRETRKKNFLHLNFEDHHSKKTHIFHQNHPLLFSFYHVLKQPITVAYIKKYTLIDPKPKILGFRKDSGIPERFQRFLKDSGIPERFQRFRKDSVIQEIFQGFEQESRKTS